MDISNKSLALLLVAAIVVSIGGTMISLNKLNDIGITGLAPSDTGEANLSVAQDITITFSDATLEFGSGYVNDTDGGGPVVENCTLNSSTGGGPAGDCVNFNDASGDGLEIRNDGNVAVNLNVTSNSTADAHLFPGTTDSSKSSLKWRFTEVEGDSCNGTLSPQTYTEVSSTSPITVCDSSGFQFDDTDDQIAMDIEVVIPQDADPGDRRVQFTALGYE